MQRLLILLILLGPSLFAQPQRKTVKEFLKLSASDTTSYAVSGVVSKIRSSSSGSFWLQDNTGTLLVYGLQDPAKPGSTFKQMDIVQGDTLTVLGRFTVYGGNTLEMKDGRLLRKADGPQHNISFYDRLERRPVFKGKEGQEGLDTFRSWVYAHAKTPAGCEGGTVRVKFVIGRKGGVQEIEILSSPSPLLSAETQRVLESSPKWKPAIMDGAPVRMTYTLTLNFN
ncbi:MAG: energy transducer TonB [Bacteroidales bacterium]|nr:energy transducer TonB [Bacteroidales bacterium]